MPYLVHYGVKGMRWGVRKDPIQSIKDTHYNRNKFNTDVPKTESDAKKRGWVSGVSNNAHQRGTRPGERNVKYVSPDGHKEGVYNHKGELIGGSYNYGSPIHNPMQHLVKDVAPWIIFGSTPTDKTTAKQRTKELFGLYGDKTITESVAERGKRYVSKFSSA